MTRSLTDILADLKRVREELEGPQAPSELRRIHARIAELEEEARKA